MWLHSVPFVISTGIRAAFCVQKRVSRPLWGPLDGERFARVVPCCPAASTSEGTAPRPVAVCHGSLRCSAPSRCTPRRRRRSMSGAWRPPRRPRPRPSRWPLAPRGGPPAGSMKRSSVAAPNAPPRAVPASTRRCASVGPSGARTCPSLSVPLDPPTVGRAARGVCPLPASGTAHAG